MRKLLLILGIAIHAPTAMAECVLTNDFDGLRCLSEAYKNADISLNKTYISLNSKLDLKSKKIIRDSQLRWITLRDQQCGHERIYQYLFDMDCAIKTTQERDKHLQMIQHECKEPDCLYNDPDLVQGVDIKIAFLTGFLNAIKSKDMKRFMQHMNNDYIDSQLYGTLKGDAEYFFNSFLWGINILDGSASDIDINSIEKIEIISYEPDPNDHLKFKVNVLVFWHKGQSECAFTLIQDPDTGSFSIFGSNG